MRRPVATFRYQRGLTMLELMVTLTVLAILVSIAVPNVQEVIKNNRVTGQNNELIALINLARNESIRRNLDLFGNEDVALRLDSAGSTWTGNVVVTAGATDPGCPPNVIRCVDSDNVALTPGTLEIRFDSRGYLANFAATTICLRHENCNGERQHRALTVLPSGRVESVALACGAACP